MRTWFCHAAAELGGLFTGAIGVAAYLKARAAEPSTWTAIGAAATGAALVQGPWAYLVFATGAIVALLPGKRHA